MEWHISTPLSHKSLRWSAYTAATIAASINILNLWRASKLNANWNVENVTHQQVAEHAPFRYFGSGASASEPHLPPWRITYQINWKNNAHLLCCTLLIYTLVRFSFRCMPWGNALRCGAHQFSWKSHLAFPILCHLPGVTFQHEDQL